jgi:hypothetical protein
VANLYSQVPSRIPDANDNDSFPSECHWVLIVSTVEVLSFELFDSYKRQENNYCEIVYVMDTICQFLCRV